MDKHEILKQIRMLEAKLAEDDDEKELEAMYSEDENDEMKETKKSEEEEIQEEIQAIEEQLESEDETIEEMHETEMEEELEDALKTDDTAELFDYPKDNVEELLDVEDKAQPVDTVVNKPTLAKLKEASMRLDRVAEALEAKGGKWVKYAYRIDKLADMIDEQVNS